MGLQALACQTIEHDKALILQTSPNRSPEGANLVASTVCPDGPVFALINQLQQSSEWYTMEDVNYVPPPSTGSRKEQPIHRDHISASGEVSLPWYALVARQLSRSEVAKDKDYQ